MRVGYSKFIVFVCILLSPVAGLGLPQPQFVPGEGLVKFRPSTEGGKVVTRAGQVTPVDLRILAPVVSRFSSETGIPLKAKQLQSGNWILLSVDAEELTSVLVRRLCGKRSIAEARKNPHPCAKYVGFTPPEVLIRFRQGTPESEAVARRFKEGSNAGFTDVLRQLQTELGLPLRGEVVGQDQASVWTDPQKLTLAMVERLKASHDVEAAQLNYILKLR